MIKLLRKMLDKASVFFEEGKPLSPFKPLFEAMDSFMFGVGKVTKGAPHIRDNIDLKRYMITVFFALVPSVLAGIYFFGPRVIGLIMVSYIFGGICEVVFCVIRKHEINEGFLITGLIYPLILPPSIPFWMAAVGIMIGVIFGKEVFGGTGKNIFNPALVGRVFIAIAFPVEMTTKWKQPLVDAVTSATPLMNFKGSGELVSNWNMLIGSIPGSVGETCKIAIILGGIFLMLTKVSNWRIPVGYIGAVAVLGTVFHGIWPMLFAPSMFQILSGGLLFGAMFMATDPVTAPFTNGARWVYGILLGLLTLCIRGFSGYVEGVMFAIIFMNIFSPLIDQMVLSIRFKDAKN